MDRKRVGLKLDPQSKKELLESLMSHVKQDQMPKSLQELLRPWMDGSSNVSQAVSDEDDEEATTAET